MTRKTDVEAIRNATIDEVVAILRVALANDWSGCGVIASVLALKHAQQTAVNGPGTKKGIETDPG